MHQEIFPSVGEAIITGSAQRLFSNKKTFVFQSLPVDLILAATQNFQIIGFSIFRYN